MTEGLKQLAGRLAESPRWAERLAESGFTAGDLAGAAAGLDSHAALLRLLAPFPGLSRADLRDPTGWMAPRGDELSQLYPAWSSGSSGQGPLAVPRFDADVAHRHARTWEAAAARGVATSGLQSGAFLCALPGRPEGRAFLDAAASVPVERVSLCREGWEARIQALEATFWNLSPVGLQRALEAHQASPLPRPRVVFSTALQLGDDLRVRAEQGLGCPVVDLFSTAETGPFAAGCPGGGGAFHVLAGGFAVEVDREGLRVTRLGDSPLPLLNYRVADRARALAAECPRCGHAGPTLVGLRGRTLSEKGEHSTSAAPPRAPPA